MPLISRNGTVLAPGDFVRMDWTVARVYPARLNVVRVSRIGSQGAFAGPPPPAITMRMGVNPNTLEGSVTEGSTCTLLWRVAAVFPETGTVHCTRGGIAGNPIGGVLTAVTVATGARAADLDFVPPEAVTLQKPAPEWAEAHARGVLPTALEPDIEPDMLPYSFEPGFGPMAQLVPPILTSLSPASGTAGAPALTVTATGMNFGATAEVYVDGVPRPTTYVSAQKLTFTIDLPSYSGAAALSVQVRGLAGHSEVRTFEVLAPTPPPPPPAPHGGC